MHEPCLLLFSHKEEATVNTNSLSPIAPFSGKGSVFPTIPMDWMLPGIPPTGKRVEVAVVVVVQFDGDKLAHEHLYWDQASVLVQLGLLHSQEICRS